MKKAIILIGVIMLMGLNLQSQISPLSKDWGTITESFKVAVIEDKSFFEKLDSIIVTTYDFNDSTKIYGYYETDPKKRAKDFPRYLMKGQLKYKEVGIFDSLSCDDMYMQERQINIDLKIQKR